MSTLTDRYVWAVVRLLPEDQRPEVDRELRSLIADMADHRTAGGTDEEADHVERDVLVELGDPSRLAARYVERPRALISQEVFPEYLRILRLVLVIVVPTITALAAIGAAFSEDRDAVDIVGAVVGTAFQLTVQVAFWVTLVYAFADRWKADRPWTPDDLVEEPPAAKQAPGPGSLVGAMAVTVLTGAALVWQHVRSPLRDDGERIPFLHPDIWEGPGQALLGLLALSLVIQALVFVRRGWTYPLAGCNAGVNLAFLGTVTWLALDDQLINPRFLEVLADQADFDQVPSANPWIPIVLVAIIEIWDGIDAFIAARHNRSDVELSV